jgi:glycosyltransferase involved in cell wall biosynthesis
LRNIFERVNASAYPEITDQYSLMENKLMKNSNILMVGNFSSDTGYAWRAINSSFAAIGRYFLSIGRKAFICYPNVRDLHDEIEDSGINVYKLDFEKSTVMTLIRFVRRNKIGVIYLIDKETFSVKYLLLRLGGVKFIIVHDRTSGERTIPKKFKKLFKMTANCLPWISAEHVITISKFVFRRQLNSGCVPLKKISVIYNGIDYNRFNMPHENSDFYDILNIQPDRKIVICVARANIYKGIEVFINAAFELFIARKRKELFFVYCGDGPDYLKFIDIIKRKGLDDCFACLGNVNKIENILFQAFACVVPSLWAEGFGRVVIEAMAASVPVISSNIGGLKELIKNEIDGFLVEPGDHKAIADDIEKLLDDPSLAISITKKSSNKVKKLFNVKENHNKIISTIKEVCKI